MQPLSVIEYLNEVEQGGFRLFPGFKVATMDTFCLERVEEALHGGVIPDGLMIDSCEGFPTEK